MGRKEIFLKLFLQREKKKQIFKFQALFRKENTEAFSVE